MKDWKASMMDDELTPREKMLCGFAIGVFLALVLVIIITIAVKA